MSVQMSRVNAADQAGSNMATTSTGEMVTESFTQTGEEEQPSSDVCVHTTPAMKRKKLYFHAAEIEQSPALKTPTVHKKQLHTGLTGIDKTNEENVQIGNGFIKSHENTSENDWTSSENLNGGIYSDNSSENTNFNSFLNRSKNVQMLSEDGDRTCGNTVSTVSPESTLNSDVEDDLTPEIRDLNMCTCEHATDSEEEIECNCEDCSHSCYKSTQTSDSDFGGACAICAGLLENQLQKTEKDAKRKEESLKREYANLKKENEQQQNLIGQNLSLPPGAKIEATMQHEITRLTGENLDLREQIDKQTETIRKLKKLLKHYARKLKDGDAAEIAAELEREENETSVGNMATIKHRDRSYMGMLEYKKQDESILIKNLISDLRPHVAAGLLPGLPAYVLFMCVRHTDYINNEEKVTSLLTNAINGIKRVVKKHHDDLECITMWFSNTCRLLHTLKQYSGEKALQSENTPRQNEYCLRNFDLSEFRQVFSDLAVWVYQTLTKLIHDLIQPMIVAAVLDHEAIAGLSNSKPQGMRGRSSSAAKETESRELSLDSLIKMLNTILRILVQHAVDGELVKQIFRQIYYSICAGSLNNLLLRKDMCNWSKGMQIRYNLSHLEQWVRDNKLQESFAQGTLEPITQASQLLQARKTDADVESICDMCSKLTVVQIVKILNLYTPVDEFEERVPISFIRKIQGRLKSRLDLDNTLLMDAKHTFPITFPYNPSSVALETLELPEILHIGFVTRV